MYIRFLQLRKWKQEARRLQTPEERTKTEYLEELWTLIKNNDIDTWTFLTTASCVYKGYFDAADRRLEVARENSSDNSNSSNS